MEYSREIYASVGIMSFALGMFLGLGLKSEEETPECVRWARTYMRQGLQVAFDGMTFILRMMVCMAVGAFCCSLAPCALCIPPCLLGLASIKVIADGAEAYLPWHPQHKVPAKKDYAPAENRRSRRKRQLRGLRHAKRHHRLRVRFEREVRAEYGAVIAWFFKPLVYRSVLKVLYVLRFLGWCRFIIFVLMTTRALFAYARVAGILFYACCVLVLPFLPSTYHVLFLSWTVVTTYQKERTRAQTTNQQSVDSNLSTLTPRSQPVRSAVAVSKTLTYDDRVRRWRLESTRRRRRGCERASKPSHVARSICADLYAKCAEVQSLYGIPSSEGPASASSECATKAVVSSDSGRRDGGWERCRGNQGPIGDDGGTRRCRIVCGG